MKLAAAAQATSRTFLAVKCQVSVGRGPAGREDGCPTSAFVMIATVVSDRTARARRARSEEHTSELQSPCNLVCRLLLEKKKKEIISVSTTIRTEETGVRDCMLYV